MNIGVIFAGGVGSRMHSKERPKQFLEVYNKPIIVHTIEYFQSCELIDAIVVVCVEDWIEYFKDLVYKYRLDKIKRIVPGGKTGQLSIYNGLCAAKEIANNTDDDIVLIHDGVRPLINANLLYRNIQDVKKYRSSITSGIVKETIVEIDDIGNIKFVPDRAHSRVAKAPQCFLLSDILNAHEKALREGIDTFIDSCTMMNHYGYALHMTDNRMRILKSQHLMISIQ